MTHTEILELRRARVLNRLPSRFPGYPIERLPKDLRGATVVSVGTLSDQKLVEGGGLVIDYSPAGTDQVYRLVLAFNELAMWVEARFGMEDRRP